MKDIVEPYRKQIDEKLALLDLPVRPESLYTPVRYMISLGGKRMRPVMVMIASDLFGGEKSLALNAALAIEVFHNFTLLHDDIMDKAPLRRGMATVHEKWNSDIAILSGDVMFVKSCQLMLEASRSGSAPYTMELFLKTAMDVCEGQQMDMDFATGTDVSIDNYLEMIRLKTAVLLGCSLGVGAGIAKASSEAIGHLYDFGVNLGIAFQLQDDILDVYGSQEKVGKQVGGDIISNKKTFLMLTALTHAQGSLKQELEGWLEKEKFEPREKIIAVKSIFDRLDVRQSAIDRMDMLYGEALKHLDALPLTVQQTAPLRELAGVLMAREN